MPYLLWCCSRAPASVLVGLANAASAGEDDKAWMYLRSIDGTRLEYSSTAVLPWKYTIFPTLDVQQIRSVVLLLLKHMVTSPFNSMSSCPR